VLLCAAFCSVRSCGHYGTQGFLACLSVLPGINLVNLVLLDVFRGVRVMRCHRHPRRPRLLLKGGAGRKEVKGRQEEREGREGAGE